MPRWFSKLGVWELVLRYRYKKSGSKPCFPQEGVWNSSSLGAGIPSPELQVGGSATAGGIHGEIVSQILVASTLTSQGAFPHWLEL